MKTIGFPRSKKPNEKRRALLPHHLRSIRHVANLVFESGYGEHMRIPDSEFVLAGARVADESEIYDCDVICTPKAPEPEERRRYRHGHAFFGWAHAVQGRSFVDFALEKQLDVVAWEDMYDRGRHVFWRNNELAGEAAVLHAVPFLGLEPSRIAAALIGLGNCGRGAYRALSRLGVSTEVYTRRDVATLPLELGRYDLVVNAVLWDVSRTDHLVSISDLERMRKPSMIIDISCDEAMGIESSRATSLTDPIYVIDGVLHYAVDHTPTILYRSATESIGHALTPYIDEVVEDTFGMCLEAATCISKGVIHDQRITSFQKR